MHSMPLLAPGSQTLGFDFSYAPDCTLPLKFKVSVSGLFSGTLFLPNRALVSSGLVEDIQGRRSLGRVMCSCRPAGPFRQIHDLENQVAAFKGPCECQRCHHRLKTSGSRIFIPDVNRWSCLS